MELFHPDKVYTTEQRCARTGEKPTTVRNKRCAGDDAKHIKVGSRVLYPGASLNEYFAARLVDPAVRAAERRMRAEQADADRRRRQADHEAQRAAVRVRRTAPR